MLIVQGTIDLRPWPPDCGALHPVQDFELQAGLVDYATRHPVQGVNLPQYGPLANSAEAGVAGAYTQVIDLGRDEGRSRTGTCSGRAGLSAGMAAAYYNDVEGPTIGELVPEHGDARAVPVH